MWMAIPMHCLRVGMWLATHSPKVDLMILIPWEIMKIAIDFLRVRMDIPCIACELGFLEGIDENPIICFRAGV